MHKLILILLLTLSCSIGKTEAPKKLGMFDDTFDTRVREFCNKKLGLKKPQMITSDQFADLVECIAELSKEPEKPKYTGIHYTPIIYLNGY
jgi:hypothetical protein